MLENIICVFLIYHFFELLHFIVCRSEEVDNTERRELDVQAAAASIYSTCNFITSMKNLSCSWFLSTPFGADLPRPSSGNITGVLKRWTRWFICCHYTLQEVSSDSSPGYHEWFNMPLSTFFSPLMNLYVNY